MSVTVTTARSGPFAGNGATTAFPFTFAARSISEVQVLKDDVVQTTGFTIAVDTTDYQGGTVTFSVAPANGVEILILANPSFQQTITFSNAGKFLPRTHDEGLDRAAMRDIYLRDRIDQTDENVADGVIALEAEATARIAGDTQLQGNIDTLDLGLITRIAEAVEGIVAPIGDSVWHVPQSYGAVGDGVADDAVALQAWLDAGGARWLPRGRYRSSAQLLNRTQGVVIGAGYGFDARLGGYEDMPGSRIVFDAGVAGLYCMNQSTTDAEAPVPAPTQEGSMHSRIEGIGLISLGGGGSFTGFLARTIVHARNVHVIGFSGKGFDISAATFNDATAEYGNASFSTLEHCHSLENGSHGFHIRGADANVIKIDTCNSASNGGWGFLDESYLGNHYENCHASSNALGSYKTNAVLGVSAPEFYNCYNEPSGGATDDYDIPSNAVIHGGTLSYVGSNVNAQPGRKISGAVESGIGAAWIGISGGVTVAYGTGATLYSASTPVGFSMGANDGTFGFGGGFDVVGSGMRDIQVTYSSTRKSFEWGPFAEGAYHGTYGKFMRWPTARATEARAYAPSYDQGIAVGDNFAARFSYTTATTATMPDGDYKKGDTFINGNMAAGGKAFIVCTTAGVKASTAWAAGQTYAVGSPAAPFGSTYRTNGGNIYKLVSVTDPTFATPTATAPVHGAGTVVGADGYGWAFQNTVAAGPVFKLAGAIDA